MTITKPKTLIAKVAAVDFKKWRGDPKQRFSPMRSNPHLMMVRFAYCLMHKSKAQLVQGWEKETSLELDCVEWLEDSKKVFETMAALITEAQRRIMIAGAVVYLEPDKSGPASAPKASKRRPLQLFHNTNEQRGSNVQGRAMLDGFFGKLREPGLRSSQSHARIARSGLSLPPKKL